MPLSVGDTLGPYEIVAPIGASGMGEVYRARDTRLKREVALKVLPAEDYAPSYGPGEPYTRLELDVRRADRGGP
jgi:serine/threonine protein kinase